ncbi:uncharacterized protein LOC127847412 isoform X1 [Dreissena polymorpha]|uniref:uncharacterized protein LOC127847412 isoform X1 n=1 Tax=Dreissena polymorpha TaxID=45954 RepID=UPI002263C2D4|nr:uncharacterized protein LOC127847412 isoform X1 [Dreissena polymorpha]
MDEKQEKLLRQKRVDIVTDLEPRGIVLDTLYEDGVLTENDVELVSIAPTRKQRCHVLLQLLPTRGPVAYGSLQKALLAGKYHFLVDKLDAQPNVADENARENKKCELCLSFLQRIVGCHSATNSKLLALLSEHCCSFLDNVEPRDVIDRLFQDGILVNDDIDTIMTCSTRRTRCETLFSLLLNVETCVIDSLAASLSKKYGFLVEKVASLKSLHQHEMGFSSTTQRTTHDTALKEYDFASEHGAIRMVQPCNLDTTADDNVPCTAPVWGVQNTATCSDVIDGAMPVEVSRIHDARGALKHKYINKHPHRSGADVITKLKCNKFRLTTEENDRHEKRDANEDTQFSGNEQKSNCAVAQQCGAREIIPKQVTAITSEKTSKRLHVAFNFLSALLNQGQFEKFESFSNQLKASRSSNNDLMCILGYLHASKDLFLTDFDSAKKHICETMKLVAKTSNPRYFALKLFTAKTRMYTTRKKLTKVQETLDDAMMILQTDPVGCTGLAAGGLYLNDGRSKTTQLTCLNLSKPNAFLAYNRLFNGAKASLQRAMTNFQRDGGQGGTDGFGYALCRLAILLLRCGDNGLTMDLIMPPKEDVISAGSYLTQLENSDIPIPKILEMHFRMAKCDYQFRCNNSVRALEHANMARDLAVELNMLEFTVHAQNRVTYLQTKALFGVPDMDEDEAKRVLFEETSSSGSFSK